MPKQVLVVGKRHKTDARRVQDNNSDKANRQDDEVLSSKGQLLNFYEAQPDEGCNDCVVKRRTGLRHDKREFTPVRNRDPLQRELPE